MIKLAFFQNDLGIGGIQKSLVNLLSNIDYSEFDVTLFLSEHDEENFWGASLPKALKIKYLKKMPKKYKYLPFDHAMFTFGFDFPEDEYYDLAIDFNSYQPSCALGALTIPAAKRAMVIHNNVEIKFSNEWKYRVLFRAMKQKYKYFDMFLPCSGALEKPFRKLSGVSEETGFTVIQNYIDVEDIREKAAQAPDDIEIDSSKMNFVALGRICHQKGYDIMMDIFSKASEKRDDLMLYIIGDGPDREKIESIAPKNVVFLGNKSNPYAYMNLMDAFISTSRYEGQPLNIKEAEVIGLPLYCTKNLEVYSEGLVGRDDLVKSISEAVKEDKKPDNLEKYNKKILDTIKNMSSIFENVPDYFSY